MPVVRQDAICDPVAVASTHSPSRRGRVFDHHIQKRERGATNRQKVFTSDIELDAHYTLNKRNRRTMRQSQRSDLG